MATLDQLSLSESIRSLSTSKSTTPTPIMIDKIALPENEDTDITINTLHTTSYMYSIHSPHSIQSFTSSSMTEPIITPGITPINDINDINHINDIHESLPHKLKIKKHAFSNKINNKYYRNLRNYNSPITHRREENIEIHAKRRYKLDDGRVGICQFIGQTSFANGIWVGIMLENSADGNTNGTIYGRKYFQCREGKGLFVRPNKIIKALGSDFKTRTSTKSKKKPASFVPLTHQKSISSSGEMLAMSTSSPLHLADNASLLDTFIDIDDIVPKNHSKSQSMTTKPKLKTKSKSYHKPAKKYKNKPKKYKSKGLRSKDQNKATFAKKFNITPSPTAMSYQQRKKRRKSKRSSLTPLTLTFENLSSRSADNSPYVSQTNTPNFNLMHSSPGKLAEIPIIAMESNTSPITIDDINTLTLDSRLESESPLYPYGLNIGGGTPVDTFSALRAYISQQEGRYISEEGSTKYNGGLWSSDESEGAASDSMLDDEDWVNKQHRARQASLAQTFADAITIPALHSVQQKVAYFIGHKEKWKPPKYDMVPDHSNILTEKLLHHKKHLDENIKDGFSVQKKLGPTDIGTVHGYKLPKYKPQKSDKVLFGFQPNATFLDNDKGWYPKPSKINKNDTKKKKDKHVKSQSEIVDSKKNAVTSKIMQGVKKLSLDEDIEINKYEYNNKKKDVKKVGKLCNEHQRSQSQLVQSKFKKKKKKNEDEHKISKLKNTIVSTDHQEWLEDQFTWVPKVELKEIEGNNTKSNKKNKKNTKSKKSKSKRKKRRKKRKSRIWVPSKIVTESENNHKKNKKPANTNIRISLPPMKTDRKTKQMVLSVSPYLDTPQSISRSISTTDSLSPYFSMENMKSTPHSMGITPLDEFVPMSLIEDDEEDKSMEFNPQPYKSATVPVFQENYDNDLGENSESESVPFIMDINFKMGVNNQVETNIKQKSVSSGGSVHSLFMTDNVILEESDTDQYGANELNKYYATPMPAGKRIKNKTHSASFKITKKPENKKKNNKHRSRSLFSGSSDKKEKIKQHNDAKHKYKQINSAKSYVETVEKVKFDKSDRKKKKAKSTNNKNSKKKLKQKNGNKRRKKNKIWKKGNGKNPPL